MLVTTAQAEFFRQKIKTFNILLAAALALPPLLEPAGSAPRLVRLFMLESQAMCPEVFFGCAGQFLAARLAVFLHEPVLFADGSLLDAANLSLLLLDLLHYLIKLFVIVLESRVPQHLEIRALVLNDFAGLTDDIVLCEILIDR